MYGSQSIKQLRSALWQLLFFDPPKVPPEVGNMDLDIYMRRKAEEWFHDSKVNYAKNSPNLRKEICLASYGVPVFVSGLLLLTYGELNVLDEVLEYIPPLDRHPVMFLSKLYLLMPIPWRGDQFPYRAEDLEYITNWVKQYKDRLVWDEHETCYVLSAEKNNASLNV